MKVFNRKWWSRIGLGVLGTLLAIQLVPYGRDHGNPPVTGEPTWDAPETRTLAKQACFDCHSNETEWPAYASIAPAPWLVQRDVNQGRAVLNFSEWPRPPRARFVSDRAKVWRVRSTAGRCASSDAARPRWRDMPMLCRQCQRASNA